MSNLPHNSSNVNVSLQAPLPGAHEITATRHDYAECTEFISALFGAHTEHEVELRALPNV
jgi:hypothetical protein